MVNPIKLIRSIARQWRVTRQMRTLCKIADQLHAHTGDTHFVVKLNNKPTVLSKAQFKELRQKKFFPKNFTAAQLRRVAFYVSSGKL